MSFQPNKAANNTPNKPSRDFKKKVSLWYKTSKQGRDYINLCITDADGTETWVALFKNKDKKTERSPDYIGIEFTKEGEATNRAVQQEALEKKESRFIPTAPPTLVPNITEVKPIDDIPF